MMIRLLPLTLLLLWLTASPALAAGLSPNVYNRLNDIREQMDAGRHQQSQRRLQTLLKELTGDAYAQAIVRQHLGYSHLEAGQWQAAQRELSAALQSQILPEEANQQLRLLLTQVHLQLGQPKQALKLLRIWLESSRYISAEQHALAAQVFHAASRTKQAIVHLERALETDGNAPESWRRSLVGMYLQVERYKPARSALERLLTLHPGKAEYWRLLAGVEQRTGRVDRALQVTALAYRQGLLNGRELLTLARQHAAIGIPEKAARLLQGWREQGLLETTAKRLFNEAELWLLARERDKALDVLSEAGRISGNGRADHLRGRILFEQKRWRDSISALQKALQAGDLRNAGNAHLLLGIAALNIDDPKLAETQLLLAAQHDSTRIQAQGWLKQSERMLSPGK